MRLLLQRYVGAQFIMPLFVSTVFFISFLLTFELFRLTELLVTRDISIFFTLGLVGNIALTFIPLSLPIAVFFSTIYCMNRLSGDSEYIAMRAGGLTKGKILFPFLIISALLSITVYQLNQKTIPSSNFEFRKKVKYLTSSGVLAGIKPGQFFTLIPGVTLFASKATKYGRELEEVFLRIEDTKNKDTKVIFANKGELEFDRDSKTLTEKLTLSLFNGNIIGQSKGERTEKILFEKYVFPVGQNQFNDRFTVKETMLSSADLRKIMNMSLEEAKQKYNFGKKEYFNSGYEFWNRMAGALVVFVFCFLGYSLGVTGNRGKKKNAGLIGIGCLMIYYGLFFSLASLAKSGSLPIYIAVFLPAIVLAGIGVHFYRKLDWQS